MGGNHARSETHALVIEADEQTCMDKALSSGERRHEADELEAEAKDGAGKRLS